MYCTVKRGSNSNSFQYYKCEYHPFDEKRMRTLDGVKPHASRQTLSIDSCTKIFSIFLVLLALLLLLCVCCRRNIFHRHRPMLDSFHVHTTHCISCKRHVAEFRCVNSVTQHENLSSVFSVCVRKWKNQRIRFARRNKRASGKYFALQNIYMSMSNAKAKHCHFYWYRWCREVMRILLPFKTLTLSCGKQMCL